MSDLEQALSRLEAHERECSIRYEMIQMQLDAHNQRFDKLEKASLNGPVKNNKQGGVLLLRR